MKKIEIKIDSDLTPEQEIYQIAKKLQQKQLSGHGRNQDKLRLGTEVNVNDIQTQIIITRVSKEKPLEYVKCNVCNSEYEKGKGKFYYHNYGGGNTRRAVCSEQCRTVMIDNFGARISKNSRSLANRQNFW